MLVGKMNPGRDDEDPASQGDGTGEQPAWQSPLSSGPLAATVALPGSKSLTGRELILSSLANAPGTLRVPLHSRDTQLMTEGLRALGVQIDELASPANAFGPDLRITPTEELTGSTSISCGLAGTVMRFLPAVAALALGPVSFDGDPYARKRPMRPVLDALRALGADISDDGRGALPFTVHGTGSLRGGRVELDASLSSQFVSGLLLAAPRFDEGVHVVHTGERLPSVPHIEMTLEALRRRGVVAETVAPGEWRVQPGPIFAADLTIEPDLSNAAPFLAAALVAGGSVSVPHWPVSTTQVGNQLRTLLEAFGARVVAGVSSEEKGEIARQAGADEVIVYGRQPFDKDQSKELANKFKEAVGPNGANVIYDAVGGDYAEPALRSIGCRCAPYSSRRGPDSTWLRITRRPRSSRARSLRKDGIHAMVRTDSARSRKVCSRARSSAGVRAGSSSNG